MEENSRIQAKKQWNNTACEEIVGDKNSIEYFLKVEELRYRVQSWQKRYFKFNEFSGKKVLEIGVGQGTDLMQFARAGAECFGVDITENHLKLTQRNFNLQHKQLKLYNTDAKNLPFEDNSLDCVYSFGVLHHIYAVEEVISEVYRVLKPGGTVMFACYNKWSAFHFFIKLIHDGLRLNWLFSKGYSGLLATIERGADGITIKPYVKLYSKSEIKELFNSFDIVDISVHQLKQDHFYPSFLGKLAKPFITKLQEKIGWYIACKAIKPNL